MIFDVIKNLFKKDENTEQIEYLGVDKVVIKYMKVTIMSLREFLGFFNKTTYTREEFDKGVFMNA